MGHLCLICTQECLKGQAGSSRFPGKKICFNFCKQQGHLPCFFPLFFSFKSFQDFYFSPRFLTTSPSDASLFPSFDVYVNQQQSSTIRLSSLYHFNSNLKVTHVMEKIRGSLQCCDFHSFCSVLSLQKLFCKFFFCQ